MKKEKDSKKSLDEITLRVKEEEKAEGENQCDASAEEEGEKKNERELKSELNKGKIFPWEYYDSEYYEKNGGMNWCKMEYRSYERETEKGEKITEVIRFYLRLYEKIGEGTLYFGAIETRVVERKLNDGKEEECEIKRKTFYFRKNSYIGNLKSIVESAILLKEEEGRNKTIKIMDILLRKSECDLLDEKEEEYVGWYDGKTRRVNYVLNDMILVISLEKEKNLENEKDLFIKIYSFDTKEEVKFWGVKTKHSFSEIKGMFDDFTDMIFNNLLPLGSITDESENEKVILLLEKMVILNDSNKRIFYDGNYNEKANYYKNSYVAGVEGEHWKSFNTRFKKNIEIVDKLEKETEDLYKKVGELE